MKILSLRLKNIRSYDEAEITFPNGSILLSGDIGSGKSSILLGIEFALFGINRTHFTGETLLSANKSEGLVELKFSVNEKEIIVLRNLKRSNLGVKQVSGHVIINGLKTVGTTTELKSIILHELGYPENLLTKSKDLIYRYTVFTPQEMMKNILFENKDIRKNILRKVFGIDKYNQIIENVQIYNKELRDEIKINEGKTHDLNEKIEQKKNINSKIKEFNQILEEQLKNKNIKYDINTKQKAKLQTLDEEIQTLSALNQKYQILDNKQKNLLEQKIDNNKRRSKLTIELAQIQEKKEKIEIIKTELNLATIEKTRTELEKQIIENHKKTTSLLEKIKTVKINIDDKTKLKEELKNIDNDILLIKNDILLQQKIIESKENIENEIKSTQQLTQDILLKQNSINSEIENAKKVKSNLESINNCPTCLQEVDDKYKSDILSKQTNTVETSTKNLILLTEQLKKSRTYSLVLQEKIEKINKSTSTLSGLNVKYENLSKQKNEFTSIESTLKELHRTHDSLNKELVNIEKIDERELEILKNEETKVRNNEFKKQELNSLLNLEKEKNNSLEEITLKDSEIKKLIGKINIEKLDISKKLETFESLKNSHAEIKNIVEISEKELHQIEIQISSTTRDVKNHMDTENKLQAEIKTKTEIVQRSKTITSIRHWLTNKFTRLVSTIEKHTLLKIHTEFNEFFMTWFNILMEDQSIGARLDEDFTPIVEINGYEIAIENLSGGEKTAVALSYRIALNMIINDVMSMINTKDLLILDEPTDGFSSEQLDKMREVLEQINIKQLIIVSHESKIESFVENILRVEKINNVSTITP